MRRSIQLRNAITILSSLLSLSHAVSLSEFAPQINGLPPACNAVYRQDIRGCQRSDFEKRPPGCSSACLNGLVQTNQLVNSQCQNVDTGETSVISLFLGGQGIQVLCGIQVVTSIVPGGVGGGAQATQQPQIAPTQIGSSTMVLSTAAGTSTLVADTATPPQLQTTPTSSPSQFIAATPGRTSETQTTLSSSPTAAIIIDTGRPPPSKATSAAESTATGSNGSGGGSPFDTFNGASTQNHISGPALGFFLALSLLLITLQ